MFHTFLPIKDFHRKMQCSFKPMCSVERLNIILQHRKRNDLMTHSHLWATWRSIVSIISEDPSETTCEPHTSRQNQQNGMCAQRRL